MTPNLSRNLHSIQNDGIIRRQREESDNKEDGANGKMIGTSCKLM